MKNVAKYHIHQWYKLLQEGMPVMIFIMLIFFGASIIGFQKDNRSLLKDTKRASQNTEVIVSKQDETLDAIKALSLDNKLTSKQLGDTIICMLLVPVTQRTTQTQDDCRKEAIVRTPPSSNSGSTPEQPAQKTPTVTTTQATPQASPQSPQPSLVQQVTQPVVDLLNKIF